MLEKREDTRQLTLRTGRIVAHAAPETVACAVLNISSTGACILVPDGAAVADAFDLAIDGEDMRRNCKLVWRRGPRIGLAFSP